MKQVEPQPGSEADHKLDLVWVSVGLQFDKVRTVSSTACEGAWVGFLFPNVFVNRHIGEDTYFLHIIIRNL